MPAANHDDAYVRNLFDRMGPTYDAINLVSSFGFSEFWRWQCVRTANIRPGDRVCDMMAGSGECWRHIHAHGASVVSVDFSKVMAERQVRRGNRLRLPVDIRCENALECSIADGSIDRVVGAFGLKTLDTDATRRFALEIHRILRPGGRISLVEISHPEGWWLAGVYRWYVGHAIPLVGKVFLGDVECYRMLGVYTREFGSCDRVVALFADAGLEVSVRRHFFGCATSIVGSRPRSTDS